MKDIKIDFGEYFERHITLQEDFFSKEVFPELLENFEKDNIFVVKIIVICDFSSASFDNLFLLSKKYPITFLSDSKNVKTSAYIFAIQKKTRETFFEVEYLRDENNFIVGTFYKNSDGEFLIKTGAKNKKEIPLKFEEELKSEYEYVSEVLEKYNFTWKNIYRFWNYMEDIFSFYKPFNIMRDSYFEKNKIFTYPAATGIEAKLSGNKKVFIGFESFKSEKIKSKRLFSEMQQEASKYGPKFSRAITLDFGSSVKKIYVSGTSTVGKNGESLFEHELSENVNYVLDSVQHLLSKEQIGFENITHSIVYCKNSKILEEFKISYKNKNLNFPYLLMEVPICRKDFLFEIECLAIKSYPLSSKSI